MPSGWSEPTLSTVAPLLPCAIVIRRARARFFSDKFGESRAGEYQASAGDLRVAMACRMRRIETDLEDFGSKREESKKEDLGQDGESRATKPGLGTPFFSVGQLPRRRGKCRRPRPINYHAAPKAAGC